MKNIISAFSALAHEGRMSLFRLLVQAGPDGLPAGEVATASGAAFTTASAQLAILSRAGLVTAQRKGRSIVYRADFHTLQGLIAFLMKDCCAGRADILTPLAELAKSACCAPEKEPRT